MTFVKEFPALLDEYGVPRNFRVYEAGLVVLGRSHAIGSLRAARATRIGQADKDAFQKWVEVQLAIAGLPDELGDDDGISSGD